VRRLAVATSVALLAASLTACSSAPDVETAGSWTVLTYSIADTDLEPYMMDDLDELGTAGSSESLNLVALVDRASDYSDDPVLGLDDWEGGRILEIRKGKAVVLDDLGDVNTGDPQTLQDFIATGIADYPADHYALVISDHGASWPGVGGDESFDDDVLDLAEIKAGISAGLTDAGVDSLDILGFDACLMATYEVASTLAPVAKRMLASQELEPGHGWNYASFSMVTENDGATADELGKALIEGFQQQATSEEDDAEITLSLTDLTAIPALDSAMDTFTTALEQRIAGLAPAVGRTRAQTLGFGSSPDAENDSYMADLGILVSEIGVDALDVSDEADAVIRALNDAVIDRVDGQATRGATGLSIYFPPTATYYLSDYAAVPAAAGWNSFLQSYYSAGDAIPAQQHPNAGRAVTSFGDDGLTIEAEFALPSVNIVDSYIRYGTVANDGTVTYLGEESADVDMTGVAYGVFDLTTLQLSDGEDTVDAYTEWTQNSDDSATLDIPMAYYGPGDSTEFDDVLLSVAIDNTGDVMTETYYAYNDALGTYGELTADTEGVIVPQVLTVDADGNEEWTATSDYGLWADLPSITYEFVELPSGTRLLIELWVEDFGGNSAVADAIVTVP
jgi:hypothetical protein